MVGVKWWWGGWGVEVEWQQQLDRCRGALHATCCQRLLVGTCWTNPPPCTATHLRARGSCALYACSRLRYLCCLRRSASMAAFSLRLSLLPPLLLPASGWLVLSSGELVCTLRACCGNQGLF